MVSPCDKSELVALTDGLRPRQGMVVHNTNHTKQAILLEDVDIPQSRVTALVFDVNSGQRDMDALSTIDLQEFRLYSRWHVAERFDTFGVTIPLPPPSIFIKTCRYRAGKLASGETCDCGCGKTKSIDCECGYCGDCENEVASGDTECEFCQEHGTCVCGCDCTETVNERGDRCGYCDDHQLCENCEGSHDTNGDGLCDSCANSCRSCGDYVPGKLNDDYECPTCSPMCEGCLTPSSSLNADNLCADCATVEAPV